MGAQKRPRRRPRPHQGVTWSRPRPGGQGADASLIFDVLTFAISFLIAVVLYPPFIHALRRIKAGQVIQAELPDSHQKKAGTPTAGGILFVAIAILGGV